MDVKAIVEIFTGPVGLSFLVELLLKSSVVLGAALLVLALSRKKPASFRHLVLVVSLLGLLLLPFLILFAPGWQSGMMPSFLARPLEVHEAKTVSSMEPGMFYTYAEHQPKEEIKADRLKAAELQSSTEAGNKGLPGYWWIALWTVGLTVMLVKLSLGLYGTFRLTGDGVTIDGYPWKQLFLEFLNKTPLRRKVRLLKNYRVMVPMTWGVMKPVILMPTESENWPVEQCSSVLFHELAHIKRGDFLVRILSRVSCSFYWFNPLSWIVLRKLKREQEKACDEMVLKAGIKPSTYASHLLRMRTSIERGSLLPATALGMVGGSEFKERLMSILKKQLNLKEVKMRTKLSLFIIILLAIAFVGTAKPYQPAVDFDTVDEEVIVSTTDGMDAAPVEATGDDSKMGVDDDDEKVNKKEKKKIKEKKKVKKIKKIKKIKTLKGGKYVIEVDEEKGKGFANMLFLSDDDKKTTKITFEDGHLYVYGKDNTVKKIKCVEKDGKKHVFHIKKGDIWISDDEIEDSEHEGIKFLAAIEEDEEKGVDTWTYHIKSKKHKFVDKDGNKFVILSTSGKNGKTAELKEKIKTLKQYLEEAKKKKDSDPKETYRKMQEELAAMEKELEKKELHKENITIHMETADVGDLLDIHEDEGHESVTVDTDIDIDTDEDHVLVIAKKGKGGKALNVRLESNRKIELRQLKALNKAIKKLKKSLPGTYKMDSKISKESQEIKITSPKDVEKGSHETAMKAFKAFQKEFREIVGLKGGKKVVKKVVEASTKKDDNK